MVPREETGRKLDTVTPRPRPRRPLVLTGSIVALAAWVGFLALVALRIL